MSDAQTLCYHGRRSIDELAGALDAVTPMAALAHKQLSLLHLERFVTMISAAAARIDDR